MSPTTPTHAPSTDEVLAIAVAKRAVETEARLQGELELRRSYEHALLKLRAPVSQANVAALGVRAGMTTLEVVGCVVAFIERSVAERPGKR